MGFNSGFKGLIIIIPHFRQQTLCYFYFFKKKSWY